MGRRACGRAPCRRGWEVRARCGAGSRGGCGGKASCAGPYGSEIGAPCLAAGGGSGRDGFALDDRRAGGREGSPSAAARGAVGGPDGGGCRGGRCRASVAGARVSSSSSERRGRVACCLAHGEPRSSTGAGRALAGRAAHDSGRASDGGRHSGELYSGLGGGFVGHSALARSLPGAGGSRRGIGEPSRSDTARQRGPRGGARHDAGGSPRGKAENEAGARSRARAGRDGKL